MKDVSAYLKHIREAIVKIEKYTEGGQKTFLEDTMEKQRGIFLLI